MIEIEILRTYSKGVDLSEALELAKGRTMPTNLQMDAIIQDETQGKKYASALPCRTGTFMINESADTPFGEYVTFGKLVFDVPAEYQGKKDMALILKHPDVTLEKGVYGLSVVKGAVVHVVENYPQQGGWYQVDPETGIPCGDTCSSRDPDARYLYRDEDQAFIGPVARWGDVFDDGYRRDVGAYWRPDWTLGVVVLVKETSAKPKKDLKTAHLEPTVNAVGQPKE